MAQILQLRRGTTAENAAFTGSIAEVTVDTDKKKVIVHDGITPGGVPSVTEPELANLVTQTELSAQLATKLSIGAAAGGALIGTYPNPEIGSIDVTSTGSTTSRALEDRFADAVNVKDFGAVGNGTVDDAPAIRAAFAYANTLASSTVYFPPGNYRMASFKDGTTSATSSTALSKSAVDVLTTSPRSMRVLGDSAVLSTPLWINNQQPYPNAGYFVLFNFAGPYDLSVEGIEFRSLFGGPGERPLLAENIGNVATSGASYAMTIWGVTSGGAFSPTENPPSRAVIRNCKFYDFSQQINFWAARRGVVEKCHFEWTWGVVSSGGTMVDWVAGVGVRYGVHSFRFSDNYCKAGPEDYTPILGTAVTGNNQVIRGADNAILSTTSNNTITNNTCIGFAYEALAFGQLSYTDDLSKAKDMNVATGNIIDGTPGTGANWKNFARGGNDGIVCHGNNAAISANSIRETLAGIWLATGMGGSGAAPRDFVVSSNVIQLSSYSPLFQTHRSVGISFGGGVLSGRVLIDANLFVWPVARPNSAQLGAAPWDGRAGTGTAAAMQSSGCIAIGGSIYTRKIIVSNNSFYLREKANDAYFYSAVETDAEIDFVNNYCEGWDFVFARGGGGQTSRTCRGLRTRNVRRLAASPVAVNYESITVVDDVPFEFAPTQTGWYKAQQSARRGESVRVRVAVSGEQGYGDTTLTDGNYFAQSTEFVVGINDKWNGAQPQEFFKQERHQVYLSPVIDAARVRIGYGHEMQLHLRVNKITTRFALDFSGGGGANAAGYATTEISATGLASTATLSTSTTHTFQNGDVAKFTALSGGTGLAVGTDYYVVNATGSSLQLSASSGGVPIAFTTDITSATLTGVNGSFQQVVITNPGSGYTSAPSIYVRHLNPDATRNDRWVPLRGKRAQFAANLSAGTVASVAVVNRGIEYAGCIGISSVGTFQDTSQPPAVVAMDDRPSTPSGLLATFRPGSVFYVRSSGADGMTPLVGGGTPLTGSAAPTSTPSFVGEQYVNTVAKVVYVAAGTASSADWKQVS